MTDAISIKRAFEVDNARNQNRDEVVKTFVPSEAFWRMLSAKNQIILGCRGSGKTALAKMLSHSHLAKFSDERARQAIEQKQFIGIYVPARISWMGSHSSRREIHTEWDIETFIWKLNLATCFSLLDSVESCLDQYCSTSLENRLRAEVAVSRGMSKYWLGTNAFSSLPDLRSALFDLDFRKKVQLTKLRISGNPSSSESPIGVHLHTDLFDPLRSAIEVVKVELDLPSETAWLMCLDEIEFLSLYQHKIINTHLREHSGNLYFKLTTMPYRHYTLDTQFPVPLNAGHDFEYLYLDTHRIKASSVNADGSEDESLPVFSSQIFKKRLAASGLNSHAQKTLKSVFGDSRLLDPATEDWSEGSDNYALLLEYGNEATIGRAQALMANSMQKFRDQIGRKIQGALLLKNAIRMSQGRAQMSIYSGASMLARCSDGNPRMFIALINNMFWESHTFHAANDTLSLKPIPPRVQNRVLTEFSGTFLERIQGEESGSDLYKLINSIGSYLKTRFRAEKISTDFISSVEINFEADANLANLVKASAGLGYLYPAINPKEPNRLPATGGVFQLAFVLSPHFQLMPRKGKARDIQAIFAATSTGDLTSPQGTLL